RAPLRLLRLDRRPIGALGIGDLTAKGGDRLCRLPRPGGAALLRRELQEGGDVQIVDVADVVRHGTRSALRGVRDCGAADELFYLVEPAIFAAINPDRTGELQFGSPIPPRQRFWVHA